MSLGHWCGSAGDRVEARNSRSSRTRNVGRHAKSRPFHNAIGVRIDRPPLVVETWDIRAVMATHETYETSILSSGLKCHQQFHTYKFGIGRIREACFLLSLVLHALHKDWSFVPFDLPQMPLPGAWLCMPSSQPVIAEAGPPPRFLPRRNCLVGRSHRLGRDSKPCEPISRKRVALHAVPWRRSFAVCARVCLCVFQRTNITIIQIFDVKTCRFDLPLLCSRPIDVLLRRTDPAKPGDEVWVSKRKGLSTY